MKTTASIFLVVLALAVAGCGTAPATPRSVIVIAIDTLRPDHLGAYGYPRPTSPALDRLAAEGVVFDRFYSSSTWTLPSFGSLFTGHTPSRHGAGVIIRAADLQEAGAGELVEHADRQFTRLDQSLPTLARVLDQNGFVTKAVVNNAFLNPEFGLSRGFEIYDYDHERPEREADEAVDLALAHLESADERPLFLFLHFMDVHMPYISDESVAGRFTGGYDEQLGTGRGRLQAVRGRIARGDEVARGFYTAAYDEEIAFVDQELERFFGELQRRGLWDDALLMVTSDHGEALFEHGRWEHGGSVFEEVVRVPLIIRSPGLRPGRNSDPASFPDLMPTILDALGIETDIPFHGVSLWPTLTGGAAPAARDVLVEGTLYGAEQKALIQWPYKLVYQVAGDQRLLFDLEADPEELTDLSALYPERVDAMVEGLSDQVMAALRERSELSGAELDPALMQSLRALGYIR